MLTGIANFLRDFLPGSHTPVRADSVVRLQPSFQPVGFDDFLNLNIPPREMLLNPILPERSLSMLYAPRGVGKTILGLSVGLAVASGSPLLRWSAPRSRRVLYIDGEMPLTSLQERLRLISSGMDTEISNDCFKVLAADNIDGGIDLSCNSGQRKIEPLLDETDLVILDNLSTLCPLTHGHRHNNGFWDYVGKEFQFC